jgi:Zn-dependent protease
VNQRLRQTRRAEVPACNPFGRCAIFLRRIRLFSLFGFDINVDASWLFLALLIAWTLAGAVFPALVPGLTPVAYWTMGIVAALGLAASIVIHETAHCLVARHYGMPIRGITLFIFGGVAEMTVEPNRPRDELLMAAAGPAASLALSVSLFVLSGAATALSLPVWLTAELAYLGTINGVLAIFNLVPAFPLDGGRMLRAAIWSWSGNFDKASRIAVISGDVFGIFLIVLGVIDVLQGNIVGGIWRFLIGLFLRDAAATTESETFARRLLGGMPVARVMNPRPIAVEAAIPIDRLIEDYVYHYHHRWFPVVRDGVVVGTVSTQEAARVPRPSWQTTSVHSIMLPLSADTVVTPETSALTALTQMRRTGQSRLVVARDGDLAGILSSRDLIAVIAFEMEMRRGRKGEAP